MLDMLLMPEGDWVSNLLRMTETLSKKEVNRNEEREYSRGELEMIQGKEEAADWIQRGKYIKKKDKHGDDVYVKNVKWGITEASREQTLTFDRTTLCKHMLCQETQKASYKPFIFGNISGL